MCLSSHGEVGFSLFYSENWSIYSGDFHTYTSFQGRSEAFSIPQIDQGSLSTLVCAQRYIPTAFLRMCQIQFFFLIVCQRNDCICIRSPPPHISTEKGYTPTPPHWEKLFIHPTSMKVTRLFNLFPQITLTAAADQQAKFSISRVHTLTYRISGNCSVCVKFCWYYLWL